jgi:preprotein translocase subunit SecA
MTILREEIGLKGYAQQDPILAYKREGFALFEKMTENIRNQVAKMLISMRIERQTVDRFAEAREKLMGQLDVRGRVVKTKGDIGRNQECPCGSGKKYKHCCGGTGAISSHRAIKG